MAWNVPIVMLVIHFTAIGWHCSIKFYGIGHISCPLKHMWPWSQWNKVIKAIFQNDQGIKTTSEPHDQKIKVTFKSSLQLFSSPSALQFDFHPIKQGRDSMTISLGNRYHVGRSPDETRSTPLLCATRKWCHDCAYCHAAAWSNKYWSYCISDSAVIKILVCHCDTSRNEPCRLCTADKIASRFWKYSQVQFCGHSERQK